MRYICSLTRLRLRGIRFLPAFLWISWRCMAQGRSDGQMVYGAVLCELPWTFITVSVWTEKRAMLRYVGTGAHLDAMQRLREWCSEAGVTHFELDDMILPPVSEMMDRLRRGKVSHVLHPSPYHESASWPDPRLNLRQVFVESMSFRVGASARGGSSKE